MVDVSDQGVGARVVPFMTETDHMLDVVGEGDARSFDRWEMFSLYQRENR